MGISITPTRETAIMATKEKASKSQAVRDYLRANPTAKNQEVVEALSKKGITISSNYISIIKSKSKTRRKAVKRVVARRGIGIPELKAAIALLKVTGSVAAATDALTAAQEIREMI